MGKQLNTLRVAAAKHPAGAQHRVQERLQEPESQDLSVQLGEPLGVSEVARLIGCSAWTVKHRLIPLRGLPHFRSGPSGKLIFYRDQVVAWILHQQGQHKQGGAMP
jgi:hypothetical protein